MPLFEYNPEGFKLHSGRKSTHRIDCDELSDSDLHALAYSYSDLPSVGAFKWIIPVMRGGLRFANILSPMVYSKNSDRVLIVDDVWTTGRSVKEAYLMLRHVSAVVIFARSETPYWVTVASDPWFKGGALTNGTTKA